MDNDHVVRTFGFSFHKPLKDQKNVMNKLLLISLLLFFLLSFCTPQNDLTGNWISTTPEKTVTGIYGIRQFNFHKDNWNIQYTVYLDSSLKLPVFTFRATGKFIIGEQSATVTNARLAVFTFSQKYLTLRTKDTAIIRRMGLSPCNLTYLVEKNITETGCAYLVSKLECAQEYDLVSMSGKALYLGARPQSGGMCEESRRPKALGLPLKRIQ